MKALIHHNPACGTSRKTLEILRESGADITINEYLKTPPSRDELKRLYGRARISPREGLRSKEPLAEELGLTGPDVTDEGKELPDGNRNNQVNAARQGIRLHRPRQRAG